MITTESSLGAWLRLLGTPGIGPERARALLRAWGPPEAVWARSPGDWAQVVGHPLAQAMAASGEQAHAQAALTWQWRQEDPEQRAIVALGDADYPPALLHSPDPPCLLYAQGRIAALAQLSPERCLAVVGSRNPSAQGRLNAQALAREVARAGVTVVSGLALGIDGAAHEGALDGAPAAALATVAVVGTGLDRVYPRQHHALAHRIAQRGLLLSECPLGTPPRAENFPRRNRILAALAQGTLVVEAALESGSLITARLALEMGREVMAVPGSIHAPQSKGCHALLRQGAKLVEGAQDVLEELRLPDPFALSAVPSPSEPEAATGLLALLGHDPVALDALQALSGLDTAALQTELLNLELAGQLARLPGGRFQRLVKS